MELIKRLIKDKKKEINRVLISASIGALWYISSAIALRSENISIYYFLLVLLNLPAVFIIAVLRINSVASQAVFVFLYWFINVHVFYYFKGVDAKTKTIMILSYAIFYLLGFFSLVIMAF